MNKIIGQSGAVTEKITDFIVSAYGSAGEHMGLTFLSLGFILNLAFMLIPAYYFYNILNLEIVEFCLMLFAPLVILCLVFWKGNPIYNPPHFVSLDLLSFFILLILSIIWVAIYISIVLLIPKAEEKRRSFYCKKLSRLLYQEGHISMLEMSDQLSVSEKVIKNWSSRISPDYGIKRVNRHIKVEPRRVFEVSEMYELLDEFIPAREEIEREMREKQDE